MYNKVSFFLSISALLLCLQCQTDFSADRPNIVFILVDDLGYHDLGVTGSTYYETPNVDRIAREGTQFTKGYACSRVCSPSRASIMLGQFTARHKITDWIGARIGEEWSQLGRQTQLLPPQYVRELPAEPTVLPEAFRIAGYQTFFAGKWHLGSEGSYPEDHGFDINVGGYESGSPRGGYFSPYENPKMDMGPAGENLTLRLGRETANFIKGTDEQPFFAMLSFYAVHGPIQTTQPLWQKYREKAEKQGISESGFEMERRLPIRVKQDNPVYAGLVESMDQAVGMVLDALDEMGLAENTIVVFTSDNGGVASGDAYSTSNLPLRGGKGYQWEGGIREPYFIKAPMVEAVSRVDVPVTGADFYPTLLDLAGIASRPEVHLDGRSLLPLLKGETLNGRKLIWHYPHYGNQGGDPSAIIQSDGWKLIHYFENDQNELYRLSSDPSESNNVAADHPEQVAILLGELQNYLSAVNANMPSPDPNHTLEGEAAYLEKIRSERWPALERQRNNFLDPSWDPGNEWWDSALKE